MYLIGNFIIQSDRYVYRMVLLEIGVYARVERGREGGGGRGGGGCARLWEYYVAITKFQFRYPAHHSSDF